MILGTVVTNKFLKLILNIDAFVLLFLCPFTIQNNRINAYFLFRIIFAGKELLFLTVLAVVDVLASSSTRRCNVNSDIK